MREHRRGGFFYGKSNLERAFDFEDQAFRKYLQIRVASRNTTPSDLLRLASEMSTSPYPLVGYAGGWAAAEAALFRPKPSTKPSRENYPLESRLEALQTARALWVGAVDGFRDARHGASTEQKAADFLAFEVRSLQALAYLPTMELAAHLLSDLDVPQKVTEDKLKETKERVVDLGSTVMELQGNGKEFLNTRSGLCNEILAGLLIQNDRPLRYLITPASLRQDNNVSYSLRADLVALSVGSTNPRTLIQVTSDKGGSHKGNTMRFVVQAQEDMVLRPGQSPRETLRAFLERERTWQQHPELDALTQKLTDRFAAFSAKL